MQILHIVPYWNLTPPTGGGSLRCSYLTLQLSRIGEVDMVALQNLHSIQIPGVNRIGIFCPDNKLIKSFTKKGIIAKIKKSISYKIKTGFYNRPADLNYLLMDAVISKGLLNENFDVVVFEHIQSMFLAKQLRIHFPKALFILDAHNVDHLLLEEENREQRVKGFEKHFAFIKKVESNLLDYVSVVWACSSKDAESFRRLNGERLKVDVIPNGVDTVHKKFIDDCIVENPTIVFCGDLNTVANKTGLSWFLDHIWPQVFNQVEKLQLLIAGNGDNQAEFDDYKKLEGVKFLGKVPDLFDLYKNASISIAPLTVGSGTRLKILEALSYGIPMVATSKAAEGVPYNSGEHLLIADTVQDFAENVVALLNDPALQRKLRLNGRSFVEQNFDWTVVGDKMKQSILNSI